MKIDIRRLEDKDFSLLPDLFNDSCFYFRTKRPESLNEGRIKELVIGGNNSAFLIFIEEKVQGILSFEPCKFEPHSAILHFRLMNQDAMVDYIDEFRKFIYMFAKDRYSNIKARVYGFDDSGKEFCTLLSFEIEAVLKKHVYKFGEYHPLIIYSKDVETMR